MTLIINFLCIAYLTRDLDLQNFETKTRGTMKELIEPILHKGQKDREMILVLEKEDERLNERINLLDNLCEFDVPFDLANLGGHEEAL